jgi:hypothetical protein
MDFFITTAHPDLLKYVDHLQKKNLEALSFYPMSVFERESERGRIMLSILNGQPCGYIYRGSGLPDMRCHQICIQYDVRRKLYGGLLVGALESVANSIGSSSITLRCAFDLDANAFWRDLGYSCVHVAAGGIRRNRKINVWRKALVAELFSISIEPSDGKASAAIWSKTKKVGLVTQFNRGKSLEQYRRALLLGADKEAAGE